MANFFAGDWPFLGLCLVFGFMLPTIIRHYNCNGLRIAVSDALIGIFVVAVFLWSILLADRTARWVGEFDYPQPTSDRIYRSLAINFWLFVISGGIIRGVYSLFKYVTGKIDV